MFARIASGVWRRLRKKGSRSNYGLRSREAFRLVLELERQRADRTLGVFSLLTFAAREREAHDRTFERLADILRRRLRMTDQMGWMDDERLGVLLPDTPAQGAWKVADDVCMEFDSDVVPPLCTVHAYPADETSGDNGDPSETAAAEGNGKSAETLEALFTLRTPLWKRALDIAGAGTALVILTPFLLLVAAAIRLTSPGPALFTQERSGEGGRRFRMFKFRTMVTDAESMRKQLLAINEQDGPAFKIRNDPRVTRLGRILRTTSIDELPQLWNVIRGDMSLVGPRPLPCIETDGCDRWQRRRLDVRPGLTCIWQVNGRSQVTFDEWVRMDLQYIQTRAIRHDLKLILQTVPAVLMRRGAH